MRKRLLEHLKGVKSNILLQRALKIYGLSNFEIIIFETYNKDSNVSKHPEASTNLTLIQLEGLYLLSFEFNILYNFKLDPTSMAGYKHTAEALEKIVARYITLAHPMLGKKHTAEAISLIQASSTIYNNGMYGKQHTNASKQAISIKMSTPVSLYKADTLIKTFASKHEAANYFNVHKSTVSKWFKLGKDLRSKILSNGLYLVIE